MRLLSIILFILSPMLRTDSDIIKVQCEHFLINNLGQYLIVDDSGLHLLNMEGDPEYQFSENLLGQISSIDLSTSMRPVIFYADIPAFQVLDNTLSPHGPAIELSDMGLQNVTHLCASSNNGYWTYDPVGFELRRMNEQLNILIESGNLNSVIGSSLDVNQLIERGNRLYLNDRNNGIHIFDFYGTYIKSIPEAKGSTFFDVNEKQLLFIRDNQLLSMTLSDRTTFDENIPSPIEHGFANEELQRVVIGKKFIYISSGQSIQRVPR